MTQSTGTAGRRTTSSSPRTPLEAAGRGSCAPAGPGESAASHLGLLGQSDPPTLSRPRLLLMPKGRGRGRGRGGRARSGVKADSVARLLIDKRRQEAHRRSLRSGCNTPSGQFRWREEIGREEQRRKEQRRDDKRQEKQRWEKQQVKWREEQRREDQRREVQRQEVQRREEQEREEQEREEQRREKQRRED